MLNPKAPMLDSMLAYLYSVIGPVTKKIPITREGSRPTIRKTSLLPEGYVAEVVATGFHSPVHCCFDEQGSCLRQ